MQLAEIAAEKKEKNLGFTALSCTEPKGPVRSRQLQQSVHTPTCMRVVPLTLVRCAYVRCTVLCLWGNAWLCSMQTLEQS